jgi:hypothetical protein
MTLVFKKNANFFAENWEKSQKILIIASTPGAHIFCGKFIAGKMLCVLPYFRQSNLSSNRSAKMSGSKKMFLFFPQKLETLFTARHKTIWVNLMAC